MSIGTPRPVRMISGIMMIWNGTKAHMNSTNRKVFAHFTFHSASA